MGTVTGLDLALDGTVNIGPVGLFVQHQVLDVLKRQAIAPDAPSLVDRGGGATAVSSPDLAPFDPFRRKPVEWAHDTQSPTFGPAMNPEACQQPRAFRISMGVRF